MDNFDVILTGIPRSGTTLVCYLLNQLPDTVALSEPKPLLEISRVRSKNGLLDQIDQFFKLSRRSLLASGTAISKQIDGKVPDNPAESRRPGAVRLLLDRLRGRRLARYARGTLRRIQALSGVIKIEKALSQDFLLCIKQNPLFTALLEHLLSRYPCYALIRNPLATLASWNSVAFPGWDGHAPLAEHLDRDLAQRIAQREDRLGRQISLLSWWFEKYHNTLASENILRYEDIVESGGATLVAITKHAAGLAEPLKNKNDNKLYDPELAQVLGNKLLQTDGAFWEFYIRESVEQLLVSFKAS